MTLNLCFINSRIQSELCHKSINKLTDENLLPLYLECVSVKKTTNYLTQVLDKYVDAETKQNILREYIFQLIPPGTKGVIRGNVFNAIIKKYILKLGIDTDAYEICFEKKCIYHTDEIPDWFILEKSSDRAIIGMNQLDLWRGGHQINRGFKYLDKNNNNKSYKVLCVVCNEIIFKSEKNKAFKLFQLGFQQDTLCYLNGVSRIIEEFFTRAVD